MMTISCRSGSRGRAHCAAPRRRSSQGADLRFDDPLVKPNPHLDGVEAAFTVRPQRVVGERRDRRILDRKRKSASASLSASRRSPGPSTFRLAGRHSFTMRDNVARQIFDSLTPDGVGQEWREDAGHATGISRLPCPSRRRSAARPCLCILGGGTMAIRGKFHHMARSLLDKLDVVVGLHGGHASRLPRS